MTRRPVDHPGWDSDAWVVDERYIERVPRRPEIRARLERECRILRVVAPLLPHAVPVPVAVEDDDAAPWRLRHDMLPGEAVVPDRLTARDGERVGVFLRTLHDLPLAELGLDVEPDDQFPAAITRMEKEVLPLLPAADRPTGEALLVRLSQAAPTVLTHRDLGPAHLLVTDGVTGVIDWTDACLGDPAIDLAWTLHGTPGVFREALLAAYRPSDGELARSLDWHRLGPWHEVLYGIDESDDESIESGLDGARTRLRLP